MSLPGARSNDAGARWIVRSTSGILWLLERVVRRFRSSVFEVMYAPKLGSLGHFFVSGADHIGKQVIMHGEYYEHDLRLVLQRVLQWVGRTRSVALDVGANIGSHSTWMVAEFDRVICVEPNTTLALICEANLSLTGQTGWTVVRSALGTSTAMGVLQVRSYANLGATRVETTEDGRGEICVRTGDDLLADLLDEGQKVDLIKIDVEGDELAVVTGLLETISAEQPILAIECLEREHWERVEEVLRHAGYDQFLVPRRRRTAKSVGSFLATIFFGQEIRLTDVAADFRDEGEPMIVCLANP